MKTMNDIIIIGGGSHAKVVIDLIELVNEYHIAGIVEKKKTAIGSTILGIPIIGTDDMLPDINKKVANAIVAIGSTKSVDNQIRAKLFSYARLNGFNMVNVIHPSAQISKYIRMGEGNMVMVNAIINVDAQIGCNTIINSGAIVEHDCVISDHVHIAPGVRLSGNVTIGSFTHIGVGAVVIQGTKIGSNVTIGAGAVVIHDISDGAVAVGVPARPIKFIK